MMHEKRMRWFVAVTMLGSKADVKRRLYAAGWRDGDNLVLHRIADVSYDVKLTKSK